MSTDDEEGERPLPTETQVKKPHGNKGKPKSPEHRAAILRGKKGKELSPEHTAAVVREHWKEAPASHVLQASQPEGKTSNTRTASRHLSRNVRDEPSTEFDEIPQLWNILTGEMSVVGPRPLLPIDQPKTFSTRLDVRPGLTGLAQISGGKLLSIEEKTLSTSTTYGTARFYST